MKLIHLWQFEKDPRRIVSALSTVCKPESDFLVGTRRQKTIEREKAILIVARLLKAGIWEALRWGCFKWLQPL